MRVVLIVSMAVALVFASTASAHVTVNPGEWEAGGFARFDVRVPNERDNTDTIEVSVQFPENVISASFQPTSGWKRTIQMAQLDQPIEQEGEEPITERIASVTWSGGKIAPGEFQEFGVSFRVPEAAGTTLVFPSVQTYSNGEVVRWIGPEDADAPAPIVAVTEPEEDEQAAETETDEQAAQPPPSSADDDEDDGLAIIALVAGVAGLLAGLAAFALTFRRTRPAA